MTDKVARLAESFDGIEIRRGERASQMIKIMTMEAQIDMLKAHVRTAWGWAAVGWVSALAILLLCASGLI